MPDVWSGQNHSLESQAYGLNPKIPLLKLFLQGREAVLEPGALSVSLRSRKRSCSNSSSGREAQGNCFLPMET